VPHACEVEVSGQLLQRLRRGDGNRRQGRDGDGGAGQGHTEQGGKKGRDGRHHDCHDVPFTDAGGQQRLSGGLGGGGKTGVGRDRVQLREVHRGIAVDQALEETGQGDG
jgi:hypothetical protein